MPDGPAWLGIGAQRCGTTWFTNLMLQHPQIRLATAGVKELHRLYGTLGEPPDLEAYRRSFTTDDGLPGEWTPYYLRAPAVPARAAAVCRPRAPILVLLRDPVDRYISAMRWQHGQQAVAFERLDESTRTRMLSADATWGGMYASQLAVWERFFPRDRMLVMQYEAIRDDPSPALQRVCDALGLEPVQLEDVRTPSKTSSVVDWVCPQDLRDALGHLYRREASEVCRRWDLDLTLWASVA